MTHPINLGIPKFIENGKAACASVDPEMFFPLELEDRKGNNTILSYVKLKEAREVCDPCELKLECLAYALTNHELGIWGGTTEQQRTVLRRSLTRRGINTPSRR